MPENKICGKCGGEIVGDAIFGLCCSCLFAVTAKPVEPRGADKTRGFADYELGEQIGRGGMGVVYEAVQRSLRRPVALKMILDSEAFSPAARRRFTIEAEAAAKLDHPNIVPIYEVGEHDGQPFFSMKLIAGENLRKKIVSGDLCLAPKGGGTSRNDLRDRVAAIAGLIATIARAVQHAHSHNVLHRDLKPANILVDKLGHPHLTDFGLAKLLEASPEITPSALTASGTALGTPSYMSPEQAAGQRLTAASDVYSLGSILYEMLTGEPPFKANTLLETLRMVAEQQPTNPSRRNQRVSKDLDTICMKCLEKNPEARYPTAEALAEDLERSLRGEPIRARRVGPIPRTLRWTRRNPMGASLIGSLCVCLAVSLALLYARRLRDEDAARTREWVTERIGQSIDNAWKNENEEQVTITSRDLAALVNGPIPRSGSVTLTFGLSIPDNPVEIATIYAEFLGEVEKRMSRAMGQPVSFDLQLYKARSWEALNGARKGVDVQAMTFLTYVRLKRVDPEVEPLVTERYQSEAVLFARRDAGISNLAQIVGHRVAFAHTNSNLSFLAKTTLAQEGLCAGDLKGYTNLSAPQLPMPNIVPRKTGDDSSEESKAFKSEIFAHREVIARVLKGEFDVGVAPYRRFRAQRNDGPGFVELHRYTNAPDLYVARASRDTNTVRALREAFVSMTLAAKKDQKVMELLRAAKSEMRDGFKAVTDADFDAFRRLLANEWVFFETCQRPPTTKKKVHTSAHSDR